MRRSMFILASPRDGEAERGTVVEVAAGGGGERPVLGSVVTGVMLVELLPSSCTDGSPFTNKEGRR